MDLQIVRYFKRWQEKEGKYPDLDIGAVEFEELKLSNISTITPGQSPSGKDLNSNGIGIPFYQGKTEFSNKYLGKPKRWTTNSKRLAKKNDILYSMRAPAGAVNIATETVSIGRGLSAITLNNDYDVNYLFYFFKTREKQVDYDNDKGGFYSSITQDELSEIKVLMPKPITSYSSYQIQQAIVEFLDYRLGLTQATRNQIDPIREKVELMDKIMLPKIFEMKDRWLRGQFNKWAELKGYNTDVESFKYELKQLNQIALFPALKRVSGKTDISIQEYQSLDDNLKQNYFALISGTTENNQIAGYMHKDHIPEGALSSPNVISWTRINGKYFFLQENPVCTNDDSFVMKVHNEYFAPFVRLSLINIMSHSAFNWSNKAGKTKIKGLEILIPVPVYGQYSSYQIQQMLVEFYGAFERFRDKVFGHIDNIHRKVDKLDEATIALTFKREQ